MDWPIHFLILYDPCVHTFVAKVMLDNSKDNSVVVLKDWVDWIFIQGVQNDSFPFFGKKTVRS